MKEDAVIVDVRKARDEHAKKFGYDVDAIADDFNSREGKDGAPVVSRPPKRINPRGALR
jgi:hypothetical protein